MDTIRLGYYFHHEDFPQAGIFDQLDVYLTPHDTDWLFPTRSAIFWVVEGGRSDIHNIQHPWPGGTQLQVGFGRFDLQAWNEKTLSGVCFGGTLIIEDHRHYSLGRLDSPAPLLRVEAGAGASKPISLLAEEIEAYLARLRSRLGMDENLMIARMSHHDPLDLYATSISILEQGIKALPSNVQHTERANQIHHALNMAIQHLQDCSRWPAKYSSLEPLLV